MVLLKTYTKAIFVTKWQFRENGKDKMADFCIFWVSVKSWGDI